MTVLALTVSSGPYIGNGATTVFPFTFSVGSAAELDVQVNGTVVTSGFTVALNTNQSSNPGGSVTFTAAPANGAAILIASDPSFQQLISFKDSGPFLQSTLDIALDRAARPLLYLRDKLLRSITVPVGTAVPSYAAFLATVKGDPGGGAGDIGLFIQAQFVTIPTGVNIVGTSGYSSLDKGAAVYTYDASVNLAYVTANPRSSFISLNGRGFRLSLEQDITPQMFGWDGVTDAAPAIQAAFDTGCKIVILSYLNHPIASKITFPAYGALVSYQEAVLTKAANIDMFDMSAQACRLKGLNIQGAGATYTGRGAYITGSYDQSIEDCDILDMAGPCLEFVGSDAGQRFRGINSDFIRTVADNPGIQMPSVDDAAGNRKFTDCGTIGGGRLIDLAHSWNTSLTDCEMVQLTFSQYSSRARITGCRIAALGGTVFVDGYDNSIIGGEIAGSIQLATTSQRNVVGPVGLIAGGTITDLSNATGDNMNYVYDPNGLSFTPVWAQTAGTGPTLGNGTLAGRLYRNGRQQTVRISGSIGSTTNKGDSGGDWTWTLASPYNRTAKFASIGTASAIDTVGSVFRNGVARIAQGGTAISVRNNSSTGWKGTVPHTWATGDTFDISIIYEVG